MTVPCACAPLAMIDVVGQGEKLFVAALLLAAFVALVTGGSFLLYVCGYWLFGKPARLRALRRRVFAALDNHPRARYGGMTTEELADDVLRYSAGFEDVSAAWTLVPYVEEWKRQRQI